MAALASRLTRCLPGGARIWRDVGAFLAGGSVTGFLAVHAAHATAVGGSTIVQFICSIGR